MEMEDKKEISYSQALAELEKIVRLIQDENCDIDKLTLYTERAVSLLKICREKLFTTDQKLAGCLNELKQLSEG